MVEKQRKFIEVEGCVSHQERSVVGKGSVKFQHRDLFSVYRLTPAREPRRNAPGSIDFEWCRH